MMGRRRFGCSRIGCLLAAFSLALTGCLHVPRMPAALSPLPKTIPDEMVITVSPMPLENDEKQRHQGMFCRVYFFAHQSPTPISTRGDLSVVASDCRQASDETTTSFHVAASEFSSHERKDLVGACYVFWFPYEPLGPSDVQLDVTFQPQGGKRALTQSVKLHLEPAR